jgi:hypothetical protein
MKKMMMLALATFFSANVFAVQMCPEEVYAQFGKFSPPSGWHTTTVSLDLDNPDVAKNPNLKLSFGIADYNRATWVKLFGVKKTNSKAGDGKISCWFFDQDTDSSVVITTDQGGIKNPVAPGTNWQATGPDRAVCDLLTEEKKVADCPWN